MTAFRRTTRFVMAAMAGAALAVFAPAAPPADAAGLRNCTELTGHDVDQVGCQELVWVDGAEVRMTFANVRFAGNVPSERLGVFYVTGPQDDTPQSEGAAFVHDHTVNATPRHGHGAYSVHLRTFFALCSAGGIASGACVPTVSPLPGLGGLPLATTVIGQMLTSVDVIESAVNAGHITLMDTGQLIVGTVSGA